MKRFYKENPETEYLLFVARAVSKDKAKYALRHIYCTGTQIVATDGHRCHVYTPEDCYLEKGYYEILKKTKTELHLLQNTDPDLMDFPDFARIFPAEKKLQHFEEKTTVGGRLALVIRAMGTNCVNLDYFRDSAEFRGIYSYQVTEGSDPILLRGARLQAVLMPAKI